jgi:hypothetical protein
VTGAGLLALWVWGNRAGFRDDERDAVAVLRAEQLRDLPTREVLILLRHLTDLAERPKKGATPWLH